MTGLDWYNLHVAECEARYEAEDSATLHAPWSHRLATLDPGTALDVGAGTGRDARWLASLGWHATAIEPSELIVGARKRTSHLDVCWIADALPDLARLGNPPESYGLILLSACWQHIPPQDRWPAYRRLSRLLAHDGLLVIFLRFGRSAPENAARGFHPVDRAELVSLAAEQGHVELDYRRVEDRERDHVAWGIWVAGRSGR